jgi:hypothetical protein
MTKEQIGIYKALAKHFKIKSETVKHIVEQYLIDVGGEHPAITIELPLGRTFRIGASKHSVKAGEMLFYKKFKKSELYADAVNLFENEEVDFVVFYSGSALMMVQPETYYDGFGGVFLKDPSGYPSFVIEPVTHYLEYHFPAEEAE